MTECSEHAAMTIHKGHPRPPLGGYVIHNGGTPLFGGHPFSWAARIRHLMSKILGNFQLNPAICQLANTTSRDVRNTYSNGPRPSCDMKNWAENLHSFQPAKITSRDVFHLPISKQTPPRQFQPPKCKNDTLPKI